MPASRYQARLWVLMAAVAIAALALADCPTLIGQSADSLTGRPTFESRPRRIGAPDRQPGVAHSLSQTEQPRFGPKTLTDEIPGSPPTPLRPLWLTENRILLRPPDLRV
jgi:hypothetical protein